MTTDQLKAIALEVHNILTEISVSTTTPEDIREKIETAEEKFNQIHNWISQTTV
jgi:uncharacterized protein (UPF0147 family)